MKDLSTLKGVASILKNNKDILLFGGTPDPELKAALAIEKKLYEFIKQTPKTDFNGDIRLELASLVNDYKNVLIK